MSTGEIVTLLRGGILQVVSLAGPMVLGALGIGLLVAIFQATTQIQEQTLTFVPKVLVILGVLFFFGASMFSTLGNYTEQLFRMIPLMAE
ncbi:MAG: flagellar biosynthesis protein FliQ [Spirochaetaceae bacterium]|jgi:flagellar biosynthetic protein FliQ|nr:flagellar biosynthesis protein FliQ [Spirochaetaceae bacterium]